MKLAIIVTTNQANNAIHFYPLATVICIEPNGRGNFKAVNVSRIDGSPVPLSQTVDSSDFIELDSATSEAIAKQLEAA